MYFHFRHNSYMSNELDLPNILLTENFLGLTGRALDSISRRSNALYNDGVFSATETSQNPIAWEAAN